MDKKKVKDIFNDLPDLENTKKERWEYFDKSYAIQYEKLNLIHKKKVGDVFNDLPEDIKSSVYMLCGALSRDKFFVGATLNLLRNFKLLKKDEQKVIIFLLERAFVEGGEGDNGHG